MTQSEHRVQVHSRHSYSLPELNVPRLLALADGNCSLEQLGVKFRQLKQELLESDKTEVAEVIKLWQQLRSTRDMHSAAQRIIERCGLKDHPDAAGLCSANTRNPLVEEADRYIRRWVLRHLDEKKSVCRTFLPDIAITHWRNEETTERWKVSSYAAEERKLISAYYELMTDITVRTGSAIIDFDSLRSLNFHPNRIVRHQARLAKWNALAARSNQLEQLFDDLVQVRTTGARALGLTCYTDLAHLLRRRTIVTARLIQSVLADIEREMVPSLMQMRREQACRLGVYELMIWDESAPDGSDVVEPIVGPEGQIKRLGTALSATFPSFHEMWNVLVSEGLIDLASRPFRLPGAFCSGLAGPRIPIVVAAFDGSPKHISTLIHELGHAYQRWLGREVELPDLWPAPSPNGEICAVSFELLAIGQLKPLYGKNLGLVMGRRFQEAFSQAVYAAAVNAFEYEIYAQPSMSPCDRRKLWTDLERRFMPWRKYGDIPLAREGGLWLDQRHIFTLPLYYCDYAIASQRAVTLATSPTDFRTKVDTLYDMCSKANITLIASEDFGSHSSPILN